MRYKQTLRLLHESSSQAESSFPNLIQPIKALESDSDSSTKFGYSLLYVVSGAITLDGINETIRAGSLVLLPNGFQQPLKNNNEYELWCLSFCPGCLFLNNNASLMRYFLQTRNGTSPTIELEIEQRPYVELLLKKLKIQVDSIDDSDIDIIRSLVILILTEVNQASLEQQKIITPIKVIEALRFIEQYYRKPISLKDVAEGIHSSPAHLATLVKKHTDYSIGHWILQHRITEACLLLTHSQKTIDEIAEQTGWSDSTHFIRQFKKFKERTPHQWKKAMLQ